MFFCLLPFTWPYAVVIDSGGQVLVKIVTRKKKKGYTTKGIKS
jgi:hypothetical protein